MHDVLEDTNTTKNEILTLFGYDVLCIVNLLTKPNLDFGNRKERFEFYKHQIKYGGWNVQLIKCFDLLDNYKSIVEFDKNFAKVYMKEFKEYIEIFDKLDDGLIDILTGVLKEYETNKY